MPPLDLDVIRELVDTVVLVMLENRSFDHMLGHLSYGPYDVGKGIDGLVAPLVQEAYENLYTAQAYYPYEMRDGRLPSDIPHEREEVAKQMAFSAVSGKHTMSGFVEAYYQFTNVNWTSTPEPMGFMPPGQVPITSFLAKSFAICDRWFAPLPASTLPNRLMAWTGSSRVDHTGQILPPLDATILDWLDMNQVPWRVYHDGLSFFALLGQIGKVLGPNFRSFEQLAHDVQKEPAAKFPKVIIIEPSYGDAPHIGGGHPNDNHPPLPVGPGEQLLRLIYRALTANEARWRKTMLVMMYDEHGGFFDHVPPLAVRHDPRPEADYPPFESTGLRIPAVVASPLVAPGTVHSAPLDHTSVLQLLAELFTPGRAWSQRVEQRRAQGITSVSRVLNLAAPRADIPPVPADEIRFEGTFEEEQPIQSDQQLLFEKAAEQLLAQSRAKVKQKVPELWHWQAKRAADGG